MGARTGTWSPDTGQWAGVVVVVEIGRSERAEQEMKPLDVLQSCWGWEGQRYKEQEDEGVWHSLERMTLPQMPRTPKCLDEQPGASPFRVWPSDLSAQYPPPHPPPPTHTQKLLGFFCGARCRTKSLGNDTRERFMPFFIPKYSTGKCPKI